jgi:hypothetical protein
MHITKYVEDTNSHKKLGSNNNNNNNNNNGHPITGHKGPEGE